jgi:hypothetical protein
MIRCAFREEIPNRTRKVQTHRERKKTKQVKSKVKSMFIIFLDNKGIVHKDLVLAGQIVNSAYYCDVLRRVREYVQRLSPKHWQQRIACCITTHSLTLPFHQGLFLPKTTRLLWGPPPPPPHPKTQTKKKKNKY